MCVLHHFLDSTPARTSSTTNQNPPEENSPYTTTMRALFTAANFTGAADALHLNQLILHGAGIAAIDGAAHTTTRPALVTAAKA